MDTCAHALMFPMGQQGCGPFFVRGLYNEVEFLASPPQFNDDINQQVIPSSATVHAAVVPTPSSRPPPSSIYS